MRFLRARLKLSQEGLARWEGMPDKPIPGPADVALRLFCGLKLENDTVMADLLDALTRLDEAEHRAAVIHHLHFASHDGDWRQHAA